MLRILVEGAGIAGLYMTRGLEQLGMVPKVIEKAPALRVAGAGMGLPMNAMAAFQRDGLLESIRALGQPITAIKFSKPTGEQLANASLTQPPFEGTCFLGVRRDKLLHFLQEQVQSPITFGTTIKAMEESPQGIKVILSDGSTEHFDLVIGAGGVHSTVRQLMYPQDKPPMDHQVTTWRWLAKGDETTTPNYFVDPTSAFLIYPMGNGEVYCYGHRLDVDKTLLEGSPVKNMRQALRHFSAPRVRGLLEALPDDASIHTGRLLSPSRCRLRKGNVVIIGDAAHAQSPSLQQGVPETLADVQTLCDLFQKISLNDRGLGMLEPVLETWESYRLPRVEVMQARSDAAIRKFVDNQKPDAMMPLPQQANAAFWKRLVDGGPPNVAGWGQIVWEHEYGSRLLMLSVFNADPEKREIMRL